MGGGTVISATGVGVVAGVPVTAGGVLVAGAGEAVTASALNNLGDDITPLRNQSSGTSIEEKRRSSPGGDGAKSKHIIEK